MNTQRLDKNEELYFTQETALRLLNVSPKALETLVDNYIVLALKVSTGEVLYPRYQFNDTGINGNFAAAVSCFKGTNASGWVINDFFFNAIEEFSNRSPMEIALTHDDFQIVIELAKQYASDLRGEDESNE